MSNIEAAALCAKRDIIRFLCIMACVAIVALSAIIYIAKTHAHVCEAVAYTHTDDYGTTITTVINGRQTITTVTTADGKVIAQSSISGRKKGG
ncbi:MAG: hypothetical protein LBI19_02880 [Oscillospiraceae bacterium]|jgi:hypothetical protein|nr:hypothetical protein [Oscillospiraceae bacterium]